MSESDRSNDLILHKISYRSRRKHGAVSRVEDALREGLVPETLSPNLRPTGVYAICDGEWVKIGIARNAQARLSLLQVGNPRKLTLAIFERLEHPERVEKDLHQHFAKRRVRGEWFSVTADEVRVAMEQISGVLILSSPPPNTRQKLGGRGLRRGRPSVAQPNPNSGDEHKQRQPQNPDEAEGQGGGDPGG